MAKKSWQTKRRGLRAKTKPRNPGWFHLGNDSRRHELTFEERQKGGIQCWLRHGFFRTDPVTALLEQEGFLVSRNKRRAAVR